MPEYPETTTTEINYPDAPSGKVIVGKYIPPFEKNTTGFGFKGVALEDKETGQLQCYLCGKWYENLACHIRIHNKISASEYKKQFGLLQSTALKCHRMRVKQSGVMIKNRNRNHANRFCFKKNNVFAGNRKGQEKAEESKNKYGVCDLQIMERICELKKELGKTPTLIDLKNKYGQAFIFHIHKRYGSYVKYCEDMGFVPNFSNHYPKYSKEYFVKKAMNKKPSIRIFTRNEGRALYKYIKGGIPELKQIVLERKK